MPYLQFDVDFEVREPDAERFTTAIAELYAEKMDAETDYTAVCVREAQTITLGRATDGKTVVLQADVRAGRATELKREFARSVIETVSDWFDVPHANQKVVFTEHEGSQMMGYDRVGDEWSESG